MSPLPQGLAEKAVPQRRDPGSDSLTAAQLEVDAVTELMKSNLERVIERDTNLSQLQDKAESLRGEQVRTGLLVIIGALLPPLRPVGSVSPHAKSTFRQRRRVCRPFQETPQENVVAKQENLAHNRCCRTDHRRCGSARRCLIDSWPPRWYCPEGLGYRGKRRLHRIA